MPGTCHSCTQTALAALYCSPETFFSTSGDILALQLSQCGQQEADADVAVELSLGADGRVADASVADILEFQSIAELVGKSIEEVLVLESAPRAVLAALAQGAQPPMRCMAQGGTDDLVPVTLTALPVPDGDAAVARVRLARLDVQRLCVVLDGELTVKRLVGHANDVLGVRTPTEVVGQHLSRLLPVVPEGAGMDALLTLGSQDKRGPGVLKGVDVCSRRVEGVELRCPDGAAILVTVQAFKSSERSDVLLMVWPDPGDGPWQRLSVFAVTMTRLSAVAAVYLGLAHEATPTP